MIDNLGIDYAVANLRGGGEYGKVWHDGGRLRNKQNVFDDFQAAGEYLISNNYVEKDKLIIRGASNGGLLVGACINQRPDLFRCAIAEVGVMDMTRFHKFTIGHAWRTDYGDPDNKKDLEYLLTYSPLHNVNKVNTSLDFESRIGYPATLLCTADHDDRVVPCHTYKFLAELQYQLGNKYYQTNPLLARIDTNVGHGAGMGLNKSMVQQTDILAFISVCLGISWTN